MPDTTDRTTKITVNSPEAKEIESIAEEIQAKKEAYSNNNLTPEEVSSIGRKWPYIDGPTSKTEAKNMNLHES